MTIYRCYENDCLSILKEIQEIVGKDFLFEVSTFVATNLMKKAYTNNFLQCESKEETNFKVRESSGMDIYI